VSGSASGCTYSLHYKRKL